MTYAEVIFQTQKDVEEDDQVLSIMSEYYFVVDILAAYSLQWVLILIPYNW